jgi:hypothetical protein
MWNTLTGECIRTFEGHAYGVNSVCLSADEKYVLSGSEDKTLRLWETVSGKCLRIWYTDAIIKSVSMATNGRHALLVDDGGRLKVLSLLWELEPKEPADWDEGAKPHIVNFLINHVPYAAELPNDHESNEEEITLALTRKGKPSWSEGDVQRLLFGLGCAGYGWLRPEGVKAKLEELAKQMTGTSVEADSAGNEELGDQQSKDQSDVREGDRPEESASQFIGDMGGKDEKKKRSLFSRLFRREK